MKVKTVEPPKWNETPKLKTKLKQNGFNAVEYCYYQHAFLDYCIAAPLIMDTHDAVSLLSD